MKRGIGGWAIPALLLLVAVMAVLMTEFVHWRRYDGCARQIVSALEEFKSRCPLARKEGVGVRLARGDRLAPGAIQIETSETTRPFRQRTTLWTLRGVIPATGEMRGGVKAKLGTLVLLQKRTLLMEAPHLHLLGTMDPSLQAVLDEILAAHGLTYSKDDPMLQ